MKSLSGNSMSTLNVDAGHVSLQAWKYAGISSIRPSSLSTIYILGCFSSSIASPLHCIISASVKCVGKVLLKPLALHQPFAAKMMDCGRSSFQSLIIVGSRWSIHCDSPLGRLPQVTWSCTEVILMTKVIHRLHFSYKCIAYVLR
jgi:hypothetical protein